MTLAGIGAVAASAAHETAAADGAHGFGHVDEVLGLLQTGRLSGATHAGGACARRTCGDVLQEMPTLVLAVIGASNDTS